MLIISNTPIGRHDDGLYILGVLGEFWGIWGVLELGAAVGAGATGGGLDEIDELAGGCGLGERHRGVESGLEREITHEERAVNCLDFISLIAREAISSEADEVETGDGVII